MDENTGLGHDHLERDEQVHNESPDPNRVEPEAEAKSPDDLKRKVRTLRYHRSDLLI